MKIVKKRMRVVKENSEARGTTDNIRTSGYRKICNTSQIYTTRPTKTSFDLGESSNRKIPRSITNHEAPAEQINLAVRLGRPRIRTDRTD